MEKDSKVTKHDIGRLTKVKFFLFATRKRISITVIVLVVILFFGWQVFGQGKKQPQYQTSQVTRGSIISTVNESGNIAGISQAGVGSPTTGIVTDMYVKDGDMVTAGQNLFKVKSIATAQEIASAYATYLNAVNAANTASDNKISTQASLEKDRQAVLDAQDAVDQMNALIGGSKNNPKTGSPYTQNEINSINSTLTSARETFTVDEQKYNQSGGSISAASAAMNSAWLSYQATQDSIVTAPIDGSVANISVKTGDQVTASGGNLSSNITASTSTSSSNNAILYIGNYVTPYVKVQASEVDITVIKPGQKATITLSAFTGKTFVGTIDQVDTAGAISSGVVTYNVYISFVAPPANIKPGMSASVTIQTARKDDVLSVPTAAIQTANGSSTVRILKNGTVSSIPVETGISSDTDTEITSGLSEGDTVITGVVSSSTSAASGSSPFGGGIRGLGGAGGFGGGAGGGAAGRGGGRGG